MDFRAVGRKRDSPPTLSIIVLSHATNAPVACSDADQVLPMFRTSGPLPLVVAVRTRLSRSELGTTSTLTLTPVCAVNLSSSGCRTCLSASRLVLWLVAQ